MSFKQGLVAAMEAEQEMEQMEEMSSDEVVAGLPEGADSLETDMLEAQDMGTEVDGQLEAVDSAEEDADSLQEIADVMDESAENGGMDQTAARIAEVAVESIYSRLGIRRKAAMPAMETFGEKGNRVVATRIACEDIKETLKKVWKAILDAIVKMSDFIQGFISKLFDTNIKMMQRAVSLKEAVGKLTVGKPNADTVDSKAFGPALGGASAGDISKELQSVTAMIKAVSTETAEVAKHIKSEDLTIYVKSKDKFDKITVPGAGVGFSKAPASYPKAPEGMVYKMSGELPGNKVVLITSPADDNVEGAAAVVAMKKISVTLGTFEPRKPKPTVDTMKTLSKPEMSSLIDEVVAISKEVSAAKESVTALQESRKKVVADIGKLSALVSEVAEIKERSKQVQSMITSFNRYSAEMSTTFGKVAIASGKAALDYVGASLKTYSSTEVALVKNKGTEVAVAK